VLQISLSLSVTDSLTFTGSHCLLHFAIVKSHSSWSDILAISLKP